MESKSTTDEQILKVWKDLYPSEAYSQGFNDCAGRLFVPSNTNVNEGIRTITELKNSCDELQIKILESIEVSLELLSREPQIAFRQITQAISDHLLKETTNEQHLISLLEQSECAIRATSERFVRRSIPSGLRIYTLLSVNALSGMLEGLRSGKASSKLMDHCTLLIQLLQEVKVQFHIEGFVNGKFEEIEQITQNYGFDLDRADFYPSVLKKAFDYFETPDELEQKALSWLSEEIQKFGYVVSEIASIYGCDANAEVVEKKVIENPSLKASGIVSTIKSVRNIVEALVKERVVGINKNYDTRVEPTPAYFTRFWPGGIVNGFDIFTRQFNIWYMTTDDSDGRFVAATSVSELLDMILHEMYGHCLHFSNSAFHFAENPRLIELISTPHQGPISEGISLNREREFIEVTKSLERRGQLTRAESGYVDLMESYGGLHLMNLQFEFAVRQWRLLRFLRVIGSVRVNMKKQSLLEFLSWASDYTKISRRKLWFEIFPTHEAQFPGYATTYAVVEEEIRSIEDNLEEESKKVSFSTYICSLGFPPRSIFRKRMEEFAKNLDYKKT